MHAEILLHTKICSILRHEEYINFWNFSNTRNKKEFSAEATEMTGYLLAKQTNENSCHHFCKMKADAKLNFKFKRQQYTTKVIHKQSLSPKKANLFF